MFNADDFMQQTVDAPLETEYKLVPEGEYKNVMIGDYTSEAFKEKQFTYKQGPKSGQPGTMLTFDIPFKITNEQRLVAEFGRDDATVYKQLVINRDDNGQISRGPNQNVELGRILDAAGLNGQNWSPGSLRNTGPFVITVVHESGKRNDGSEWKKASVGKVTRQS